MSALFFLLALSLPASFADPKTAEEVFHICYFSLNNEKEFIEADKFTKKLNAFSPERKIQVKEYVAGSESPEEAFLKMVKSGDRCDGLVISGHHTGGFGGARAQGSLNVSFLEKLSCMPEHQLWFNDIKGLWLQGCRTLGVGRIEATDTADFHTERVGAVLDEDGLEQSFADLNMEFSATLDQDNPLSSRYLRVFPQASVFGWTRTAPGKEAKSEYSVPYHIAHVARLNGDRKKYFDDPTQEISAESARRYTEAAISILKRAGTAPEAQCAMQVQAWKNHGHKENRYAFNNPDLNAFSPLNLTGSPGLRRAKELDCLLKGTKDPVALSKAVQEILSNEGSLGYSFNSLMELMQRLKSNGEIESLDRIHKLMKTSPVLQSFLARKFAAKETGVLMKIDYYAFYREMTGQRLESVEKAIRKYAQEILVKKGNQDLVDFQVTLTQSLIKNAIVDGSWVAETLKDPKVSANAKLSAVHTVSTVPIKDWKKIIAVIEANGMASSCFPILEQNRGDLADPNEVISIAKRIMSDSRNDVAGGVLTEGVRFLDRARLLDRMSEDEFKALLENRKPDPLAVNEMIRIFIDSKRTKSIQTLIPSVQKAAGSEGMAYLAYLAYPDELPELAPLDALFHSRKAPPQVYLAVAYVLYTQRPAVKDPEKLLDTLTAFHEEKRESDLKDPYLNEELNSRVISAIGGSAISSPSRAKYLKTMIEHETLTPREAVLIANLLANLDRFPAKTSEGDTRALWRGVADRLLQKMKSRVDDEQMDILKGLLKDVYSTESRPPPIIQAP